MKEDLELLLTVNHYKYVLKFCNINHGLEARSRLEGGRRHKVTLKIENERQRLEDGGPCARLSGDCVIIVIPNLFLDLLGC